MNQNLTLQWRCKAFHDLTLGEWYTISQAREQVFVVEQNCPYLDSDGQDSQAWHILGCEQNTGKLACYARILPPTQRFMAGNFIDGQLPAIGRVLTVSAYRGMGLASQLMQFAISQTREKYPNLPIYISAQSYLLPFYQKLGFISQSESYLEDGIPHIDMVL